MEPDILASTRDPLAETAGQEPVAHLRSLGVESTLPRTPGAPSAPHHAGTNGHANGHGYGYGNGNGHLNGHGRAHAVAHRNGAATTAHPGVDSHAAPTAYQRWGKRAIDLAGAGFGLLLSAPLMAVVALIIKLESRGPVFYRSTRIGRNGRPFTFLKFRSMVDGADRHRQHLTHLNECDGPVFKISRDPRVTRIGRFLRTTSLDEVPQFLNVMRGDMSLVGPRPPLPDEVAQYEPWQKRRLEVRPGITCLWQISGRSRIGFREWMRLDLEYIKHQSFWLDVRILVRTIPAVLSREGAY